MVNVVHLIIGLGNGGAEQTLSKLVAADQENHHSIISLTKPGFHGGRMRRGGAHLHCLGLRWWNGISLFSLVRRFGCLRDADVLVAWMPHAIILSPFFFWFSGAERLILNIRASSYGLPAVDAFRKLLLWVWSLLFVSIVDNVIVPGPSTMESHLFLAFKKNQFITVHNGFDAEDLEGGKGGLRPKAVITQPQSPNPKILRIGMFARWHPQKDHLTFIKSLELLSSSGFDFVVKMAGKDIDWNNKRLTQALKNHGVEKKVELLGNLESIWDTCRVIDVHVVSSAYGEAFPNVVAETMLLGVPNVVTDVGDSKFVVGRTGWVVSPRDPQSLSEALIEVASSGEVLDSKGQQAASRIQSLFSLKKMASGYSEAFCNKLPNIRLNVRS